MIFIAWVFSLSFDLNSGKWLNVGYTDAMPKTKKTDALDLSQPVNFTADRSDRLTCRADIKAQALLRDTEVPGLKLRVTNTEAKSFFSNGRWPRPELEGPCCCCRTAGRRYF